MEANHKPGVDWSELLKYWRDPVPGVIAREEVEDATGGLLNARTLANMDSRGQGPEGRFRFNKRKVGYEMRSFVRWLNNNSRLITGPGEKIVKKIPEKQSNN